VKGTTGTLLHLLAGAVLGAACALTHGGPWLAAALLLPFGFIRELRQHWTDRRRLQLYNVVQALAWSAGALPAGYGAQLGKRWITATWGVDW
jgi:fructose-specific phosphotransferase system IIC component